MSQRLLYPDAPTCPDDAPPVLCVHGIWDTGAVFDPMREGLHAAGQAHTRALDLMPNDGRADIPELAGQVARAAEALRAKAGAAQVDLVGFSMGALVSRFYLQRLGGRKQVRRFVSISGPHAGTWTAPAWSFLRGGRLAAVRSMRPGSPLLRDLWADADPWGPVEVHAFWTPMDLMILPATSSRLPGARERTFAVPLHPLMLSDRRVIGAVLEALHGDPPVVGCRPPPGLESERDVVRHRTAAGDDPSAHSRRTA